MKQYSVIRNFKRFKSEYPYFVLFIKSGDYYYTFDSDAKIMMYLFDAYKEEVSFRIEKNRFKSVLNKLHENGLNVALAGWKLSQEFYTYKMNDYENIKKKAKFFYKATNSSVIEN